VLGANAHFTLDSLMTAAYDSWLPAFDSLLPPLLAAQDKALARPRRTHRAAARLGSPLRPQSTATSLAVFWGEALWAKGAATAKQQRISVWEWMATRPPTPSALPRWTRRWRG
jgi:acyl-homoserine-lactone acylase